MYIFLDDTITNPLIDKWAFNEVEISYCFFIEKMFLILLVSNDPETMVEKQP